MESIRRGLLSTLFLISSFVSGIFGYFHPQATITQATITAESLPINPIATHSQQVSPNTTDKTLHSSDNMPMSPVGGNDILTAAKLSTISSSTTYENKAFGFSIHFPSRYGLIEDDPTLSPDGVPGGWYQASFIKIYDKNDKSTYEFHVIPVNVVVKRQPISMDAPIYHTVEDYWRTDEIGLTGASDPHGDLISVNGEHAIHYRFPDDGGAADAPSEEYLFIHHDIIFDIFFNSNDPYHKQILESIRFF